MNRAVAAALAVVLAAACGLGACGDGNDASDAGPGDAGASTTSAAPTTTVTAPTTTAPAPATTATAGTTPPDGGAVQRLRLEVLARLGHDADAFTQGLELDGDVLYESTGLYGESSVRVVDRATGAVRARRDLDGREFGEGLTVVDDTIVVLTWREHVAYVLDATTLAPRATYSYDTEGWGICDDGTRFVMSDGSDTLRFRDRATFAETGRVTVTLDGEPVDELNELECVDGDVYANVWHSDTILRIDPGTGRVRATIDAAGLLGAEERSDPEAVLNGIAHDDATGTFLLTGKRWPAMFEVRFVPA